MAPCPCVKVVLSCLCFSITFYPGGSRVCHPGVSEEPGEHRSCTSCCLPVQSSVLGQAGAVQAPIAFKSALLPWLCVDYRD